MTAGEHRAAPVLGRSVDVLLAVAVTLLAFNLKLAQAAGTVAALLWIVLVIRTRGSRRLRLPLVLPFAAFFAVSLISSATAIRPLRSLKGVTALLTVLVLYMVVNHVSTTRRAMRLGAIVLCGASVAAGYGLFQRWAHGPAYRVHGTLSHYMTYAGVLTLISTVTLGVALFARSVRVRIVVAASVSLLVVALVMTHTRSALIAVAVGVVVTAGLHSFRALLVAPVVLVALVAVMPGEVRDRLAASVDLTDVTVRERLYMWDSGWRIVADHPLTGVGVKNWDLAYERYRQPNDPWLEWRRLTHLHNNVIHVAAERGLLGLFAWVWIWVAWFRAALGRFRALAPGQDRAKGLVAGSIGAMVAFHVAGLFEYNFSDSEVVAVLYVLMAAPFLVTDPEGASAS